MSDVHEWIMAAPLSDTHEHLHSEAEYVERGPDVLRDLFDNYITSDLAVAGATAEQIARLIDSSDPDIEARYAGVAAAWERCQHTGYGEAVRLIGRLVYGMETISVAAVEAAAPRNHALRQPGGRLHLLRDLANLDHVQIDDFWWDCAPDPAGPEFFLRDLSWVHFADARVPLPEIAHDTGITVRDLASLRAGIEAVFARYAPQAVAVKSQHAYTRTLRWQPRADADAGRALERRLAGQELTIDERLCLGDWCLARGVEQAIHYDLPFKIHTGYNAFYGTMQIDNLRAGLLSDLVIHYPQARFVLMHTAYPYSDEIIALAKHFPNVYLDLCWAWSIDPLNTGAFVRRVIHTVPAHKLFVFGGDAFWPAASVAYAAQTRHYFARALDAEVRDDLLSAREAIALAERFTRTNQAACFDLARTRANLAR